MLMGWGEKSNHRKSALDGLRVDVSLAVSPWQARAEVPPTSAGALRRKNVGLSEKFTAKNAIPPTHPFPGLLGPLFHP